MLGQLIVFVIVAGLAFWWSQQGAFSALLALICTVAAGALAFSFWEPLTTGFLLNRMPEMAWGVGLLAPFALALILLRAVVDILVPGNVQLPNAVNIGVGGLFGFFIGVIVAGMLTIGLQFAGPLSMPGYIGWELNKSTKEVDRKNKLVIPVDTMTASFFSGLSRGSMSPTLGGPSLSDIHPELARNANLFQLSPDPDSIRTIHPDAVTIPTGKVHLTTTVPSKLEKVIAVPPSEQLAILRTVIKMQKDGIPAFNLRGTTKFFYIAATQVVLAYEHDGAVGEAFPIGYLEANEFKTDTFGDDERQLPVNAYSRKRQQQSKAKDPRYNWESPGRLAIRQPTGNPEMTFDWFFRIPAGAKLKFLRIKQARIPLDDMPPPADGSALNEEITLIDGKPVDALGTIIEPATTDDPPAGAATSPTGSTLGANADFAIFSDLLPVSIPSSLASGLDVLGTAVRSGKASIVVDPTATGINKLYAPSGNAILQLNLSGDEGQSMWGRAMRFAVVGVAPPLITLDNGEELGAFAYTITGKDRMEINVFEDGQTLQSLGQIDFGSLKDDQVCRIYFRVPTGKKVEGWRLGQKTEMQTIELTAP